jgi:peptidoglycan/LPS O-acetylase OafA/YrhL
MSQIDFANTSAVPQSTVESAKQHLYWLDWARFIAALMVVACHARGYTWVEYNQLEPNEQTTFAEIFFTITDNGREWVVLFFVLSGFLVGGKLIERCLTNTFDPMTYAVDRITRIWTPLIPALAFTSVLGYYCGFKLSITVLFCNLFSLQGIFCDIYGGNVPLWSLSYEVWFYSIAGLAGVMVMRCTTHRLWLWIAMVTCFAVFEKLWVVYLYCWILGTFAYFLTPARKSNGLWAIGLVVALGGICLFKMYDDAGPYGDHLRALLPSPNFSWLMESFGLGIFFADICRMKPLSSLTIRLERLGISLAAFSYTLYLTHYPLLLLWEHFFPQPRRYLHLDAFSFLVFFVKISSGLLVAWLLYLPFEAQTPAIRKWLKHRLAGKKTMPNLQLTDKVEESRSSSSRPVIKS